jgi:hypothetical protein
MLHSFVLVVVQFGYCFGTLGLMQKMLTLGFLWGRVALAFCVVFKIVLITQIRT